MKLKKLVSAGLVAIMATSLLAGCGGSKDSSETADGKKNLSIFIFANDHESTVYKSMIDQYKKDHADTIGNIDATIIAQKPKLAPYREQMVKNVAKALNINENQVCIKATTEEGLGFTGSMLGIAAHSVCLLNNK